MTFEPQAIGFAIKRAHSALYVLFWIHNQYFKIQLGRRQAPYLQWGGSHPLLSTPMVAVIIDNIQTFQNRLFY